jgi:hypothetical protein
LILKWTRDHAHDPCPFSHRHTRQAPPFDCCVVAGAEPPLVIGFFSTPADIFYFFSPLIVVWLTVDFGQQFVPLIANFAYALAEDVG